MQKSLDEKFIRKKYGEEMWHYCRDKFQTILINEGILSKILSKLFDYNLELLKDIRYYKKEYEFQNLIFNYFNSGLEVERKNNILKNPEELLKEAGYILYKCNTEEEIQSFKKYYDSNEELCTFKGGRLETCFVYFAVKENALDIKRSNNPQREDEYGTSVISIQFSRDKSRRLSIKNRYNHTVTCPDATFANNLDNIIPGLTDSFAKFEGMNQKNINTNFYLDNYVQDVDGKYYKYNFERDNVYFCKNNKIIRDFVCNNDYVEVEKYLFVENYVFDLKEKKIINILNF